MKYQIVLSGKNITKFSSAELTQRVGKGFKTIKLCLKTAGCVTRYTVSTLIRHHVL